MSSQMKVKPFWQNGVLVHNHKQGNIGRGRKTSRDFLTHETILFTFKMAVYPPQHFHAGFISIAAFRHLDPLDRG